MENLAHSERMIAQILKQLTEFGLQQSELRFSELELEEKYLPFFLTSTDWLLDEGIIRCQKFYKLDDPKDSFLLNPVITAYGFSILGQKFSGSESGETVGSALVKVSENSKSYAGVGDFIGGLLGGFTKSMGS